jgi:hypothetical protein
MRNLIHRGRPSDQTTPDPMCIVRTPTLPVRLEASNLGKSCELSTGEESSNHYHPKDDFIIPRRVRSHVLPGGVQGLVGLPSSAERKSGAVALFGRKGQPRARNYLHREPRALLELRSSL